MSHPPEQRSGRRGLVVGLSALLGLLVVVLGVLVVLLVRDGGGEPGAPSLTAPEAAPAAPAADADPTSGRGTQNFRDSRSFATAFAQRLADRDAEAAYDVLCEFSRVGEYSDPDALQERFDDLVDGTVVSLDAGATVGTAGTDYVGISVDLEGGGSSAFTVVIQEEDGHLAVCSIDDGSAAPTY